MYQINVHVAERLRRLRAAGGLSLQDLARRSGVSRAMLSQIETLRQPDHRRPVEDRRWLGVTFAESCTPAAPPVRLERGRRRALPSSGDRCCAAARCWPTSPGTPSSCTSFAWSRPGGGGGRPSPGSLSRSVNAGRLRLGFGSESYDLGPGDALLFPADRPHRYETVGRRPFVGLSLILYGDRR